MRIELLIYCYGAVCLSMILFNCVYILAFRRQKRRIRKDSSRLSKRIAEQIARIRRGEGVEDRHLAYLNRKLVKLKHLRAFDLSLEALLEDEADSVAAEQYLIESRGVMLYLAICYSKKENMQCAYYAHLLAKYSVCRFGGQDELMNVLLDYLKKDSLFCRQNAMCALYRSQSEEKVLEGVLTLDAQQTFFHSKILSDGLLTFEGDHSKLIARFWEMLDRFSTVTQTAILTYIRFESGDYSEQMLAILDDERRDSELRFCAIRYFGKYPYEPARELLLKFSSDIDEKHWEYAALSVSSLAAYPGAETVEVLKKALSASVWYVRYNAALSLEMLGLCYSDLLDVIGGNDRYAREMVLYRFGKTFFTAQPDTAENTEKSEKEGVLVGT